MNEPPPPNVFALDLRLGPATDDHTGPRDLETDEATDAPVGSMLAIRPPERTTPAPGPLVLADVRALLDASDALHFEVYSLATLTTPAGFAVRVDQTVPALIGRQPDASVVIRDSRVSRVHCVVRVEAGGVVVEDLGSTNGTWVRRRDQRIIVRPSTPVMLADGDRLHCEDVEIARVSIAQGLA